MCDIIPAEEFDDLRPCPREFRAYLEVSYRCVRAPLPGIRDDTLSSSSRTSEALPSPMVSEVCETETYRPRCNDDEVVLIEKALYGRMAIGRHNMKIRFVTWFTNVNRQLYKFNPDAACQVSLLIHVESRIKNPYLSMFHSFYKLDLFVSAI